MGKKQEQPVEFVEFLEPICAINIPLADITRKCEGHALERNWSWSVIEKDFPRTDVRPDTRLSKKISMKVTSLLRRISNAHNPTPIPPVPIGSNSWFEVAEAGTLQMEVVYIPDLKEADQNEVPDSVTGAEKWLKYKQWEATEWHRGHMHQEGGDVKYWRRRFFKAVGSKLEAYHEHTMEYRTTIDLTQLVDLIDLPNQVDAEEYATQNSFRLQFKHGEVIDFYTNTKAEMDAWVLVLNKIMAEYAEVSNWILAAEPESVKRDTNFRERDVSVGSFSSKRASPKKSGKRNATGFVKRAPSLDQIEDGDAIKPHSKASSITRNISPEKISSVGIVSVFGTD